MYRSVRLKSPFLVTALTALLLALTAAVPARADALQEATSLKFVPADVAFYASLLRTREQYDRVSSSNAIARLMQMPAVQMGLFVAKSQWENPQDPRIAQLKEFLSQPENQQLVAMIKDAVSSELFWYGQSGFAELITLFGEINTAQNVAQIESGGDPERTQQILLGKVLELLDARGDLTVPTSVTGFKLTNVQVASDQLKRLEQLATAVLAQNPQMQDRFAREDLGGVSFLTLRLDGTMIPWDQVPTDAVDVDPQQLARLIDKVKATKVTVSIGIREDYLLLSIGEGNGHLGSLGQGELLYDRPEMDSLKKAADKPICAISYASKEFMEKLSSVDSQMDQMTDLAKQFMPLMGVDSEVQEELLADIGKLSDYVKANAPEPGAAMGYAFMTPRGYESYSYNWAENVTLDASKPLTILNHVGGNPLAFYAARGTSSPEDYDELSRLLQRGGYYFEKIMVANAEPEEQEAFAKLKEDFTPLLERVGAIVRDKLAPAFEDGQGAIVLDAKSKSASWHMMLPPADPPLPMLELGLVFGVSDAGLVREAFGELFTIAQEAADKLHEASKGDLKDVFDEEIPKITLAQPQTHQAGGGTIYFYALPASSGVDKQLAPNGGLSDNIMAVSLLPRFTERLMNSSPVQGQGPLANTDRPLASAAHMHFAGLIEAIEPWINYGLGMTMGGFPTATQPAGQMQAIIQQVMGVLEVAKCFRSFSSVTYQEDEAMVTHAEWHFQDLQ